MIGNTAIIHALLRIVYNVMKVIIHNVYYAKVDIMSILTVFAFNVVFRIARYVTELDVWLVSLDSYLMQEEINAPKFNANPPLC